MVGELAVDARKVALSKEQRLFVLKRSGELIGVASQVGFFAGQAILCRPELGIQCVKEVFVGGVSQSSCPEFRSMCVNNRSNCGVYRHHPGWDRSACRRIMSVSKRIIFASSACWSYASALRFWRSFSSSTSTDRIRCTSSFLSKRWSGS
jgi:hypothetical protein